MINDYLNHLYFILQSDNKFKLLQWQAQFLELLLQPTLIAHQRMSLISHATKDKILVLVQVVLNAL